MPGKIMITGAAGFMGSNLVDFLLEKDDTERVLSIDALTYAGDIGRLKRAMADDRHTFVEADICDVDRMADLIEDFKPDVIVNCAAETHVDTSLERSYDFARSNVAGVASLLDCARRCWGDETGRRFIHISTDEVYGPRAAGQPLFAETDPLNPVNPYAVTKAAADMLVLSFARIYSFPAVILRFCNIYGPNQNAEKLIPKALDCLNRNEPVPLYGDGSQKRFWLHVSDCCSAIESAIAMGVRGEVYNVSTEDELTNLNLVKLMGEILGKRDAEQLIEFVPDRAAHDFRYGIDSSKAQAVLAWEPGIALREGLSSLLGK